MKPRSLKNFVDILKIFDYNKPVVEKERSKKKIKFFVDNQKFFDYNKPVVEEKRSKKKEKKRKEKKKKKQPAYAGCLNIQIFHCSRKREKQEKD